MKRIAVPLEKLIFSSRWLLYPMNAGLILALVVYAVRFLVDDFHFVQHGFSSNIEDVSVMLLSLVDLAMVANLITMIVQGSYQIFIKRIEVDTSENRPQWLDHIDSGLLKLKVSLSVANITLIRLLKDFVNIERIEWFEIQHRMWIHGLCLVSALSMAIIWRVTHPQGDHHK